MSKALTRRSSAKAAFSATGKVRENVLATMVAAVAEDDTRVCNAMNLAKKIRNVEEGELLLDLWDTVTAEEMRAELERRGFPASTTRDDIIIAVDAKKGGKELPGYVKMAHERHSLRYRGNDGSSPAQPAVQIFIGPTGPRGPTEKDRAAAPVIDTDEA